jgi:hypothetical protein
MGLVSLLATISGNLGLFLGMIMFSLAEIVEVVKEIVFALKKALGKFGLKLF